MKIPITIALVLTLLTACGSDGKYTAPRLDMTRIDGTTANYRFELLCDEAMDVVYIKMGHDRGGITVRLDSTGAPVRCSSIRKRRRR